MLNTTLLDVYTDYLITSFSLVTATGLSAAINHQYSHESKTVSSAEPACVHAD